MRHVALAGLLALMLGGCGDVIGGADGRYEVTEINRTGAVLMVDTRTGQVWTVTRSALRPLSYERTDEFGDVCFVQKPDARCAQRFNEDVAGSTPGTEDSQ